MKATHKIGLLLVALAVLLGAGVYGAFEFQQTQALANEQEQVAMTAGILAQDLDTDVRNTRARLSSSTLQTESLSDVDVTQLLAGPNVVGVTVVDADGTVVEDRGRTSLLAETSVGADVGDQRYVSEALQAQTYVSDPVWLEDTGRYAILVSAPVVVDGDVAGVVVTARYLGIRDAVDDPLSVYVAGTDRVAPATDETVAGIPTLISRTETISATDWEITVTRETTALQRRMQGLAALQAGGLVGVLVLVGAVAGWQYRTILRQLRRLEGGFEALEAGEYDYSLSLTGSDEWDRISEGFDHVTSELAAREETIRQREEHLRVLNRVLRHNLRNDMTVVIGRFQQLQQRSDDDAFARLAEQGEDKARDVARLSEQARQLEAVLDSTEQDLRPLDLTAIVESALAETESRYPTATIERDLPSGAEVRAVPMVGPAAVELLDNAVTHNDSDDPTVWVTVERDDPEPGETTLRIADDGPGIPAYELDVLGRKEDDLEHSSGLGLWLVHWTVEKSGAEITIRCRDDGGTEVTVTFQQA